MTEYYMTSSRASDISFWQKCRSKTPIGAKREATAEYKDGYIDSLIEIATGDDLTRQQLVVATKNNKAGSKWLNALS